MQEFSDTKNIHTVYFEHLITQHRIWKYALDPEKF